MWWAGWGSSSGCCLVGSVTHFPQHHSLCCYSRVTHWGAWSILVLLLGGNGGSWEGAFYLDGGSWAGKDLWRLPVGKGKDLQAVPIGSWNLPRVDMLGPAAPLPPLTGKTSAQSSPSTPAGAAAQHCSWGVEFSICISLWIYFHVYSWYCHFVLQQIQICDFFLLSRLSSRIKSSKILHLLRKSNSRKPKLYFAWYILLCNLWNCQKLLTWWGGSHRAGLA